MCMCCFFVLCVGNNGIFNNEGRKFGKCFSIGLQTLLRDFNGGCVGAAMAIGDASVTKGYVSELQPSTKLHQSSFESEPTRNKVKKPDT